MKVWVILPYRKTVSVCKLYTSYQLKAQIFLVI